MWILDVKDILNERADTELRYLKKFIFSLSKLLRDLNPGDLLVKQFLKIKKTLARLWFRGYLSGRND
uniref:Uncharacterized protein n=1 Tax=Populus trichocarpa TaxID=3694 RepID=A0A2K1WVA6_POPTR